MHNTSFFMQVPDASCDLQNDMSREFFAEVGQLDDLVKQFSSLPVSIINFISILLYR